MLYHSITAMYDITATKPRTPFILSAMTCNNPSRANLFTAFTLFYLKRMVNFYLLKIGILCSCGFVSFKGHDINSSSKSPAE